MTTWLGKSCIFDLLCVSFVNVYYSVCASFPSGLWVTCGIGFYLFLITAFTLTLIPTVLTDARLWETLIFFSHLKNMKT